MTLWHADIRLPDIAPPRERVVLGWTKHADKARVTDRYGVIPSFDTLPLSVFQVVEVETRQTPYGLEPVKWVMRGHWTPDLDVVFVLLPGTVVWTVKTVWINERGDSHKTLDRSRYQA